MDIVRWGYIFRYDTNGDVIQNDDMHEIKQYDDNIMYKVKKASLKTAGTYKVQGVSHRSQETGNCPQTQELLLNLYVYGERIHLLIHLIFVFKDMVT